MKLTLPWLRILWITFVLALPAVILYSLFTRVVKCPACYLFEDGGDGLKNYYTCLLYTSPSPRDRTRYRMPSSA